VFNPPVTGREVHDENGVYPLLEEGPYETEEVSS
jgi:L-ectoine synthase